MEAIQQIVNNQVQTMIDSGAIQKSIELSIEKSINSAINAQFESYGNLTKQIKDGFEEGLKIDFKDMPFESYNQQMLAAIKTKISNLFAAEASTKFMLEMDKVLEPAPLEIHIKDLVEKIVEFWKKDDHDNLDEYAKVEFQEWEYSSRGEDFNLKMWKNQEDQYSSSSPDLQLFISSDGIRINHKHSYNPTCFSEDDAFIFRLYSAGTKITGMDSFNSDDCDLTLKSYDEY